MDNDDNFKFDPLFNSVFSSQLKMFQKIANPYKDLVISSQMKMFQDIVNPFKDMAISSQMNTFHKLTNPYKDLSISSQLNSFHKLVNPYKDLAISSQIKMFQDIVNPFKDLAISSQLKLLQNVVNINQFSNIAFINKQNSAIRSYFYKDVLFPKISAYTNVASLMNIKDHYLPTNSNENLKSMAFHLPSVAKIIDYSNEFRSITPLPETEKSKKYQKRNAQKYTTYDESVIFNEIDTFNSIETDYEEQNFRIHERYESSPKDRLSLEFYLSLFYTMGLFALDSHISNIDKKDIINSIKDNRKYFNDRIKIIEGKLDDDYIYFINKPIFGYNSYDKSKRIIAKLYPNQKVRLIMNRGHWIKVEYFNNFSNEHNQAWILKKYTFILKFPTFNH